MGKNFVIVRRMRTDELDSTLIALEYMLDEVELPDYDDAATVDNIRTYNIKADHVWFNAYENTRVVGSIGAYIYQDDWSLNISAHIQYFYVLPSHRDTLTAKQLVEDVVAWAKNIGAKKMTANTSPIQYLNDTLTLANMSTEVHYIKDL